ncbi:PREDICTED: uncharacterized protein LOC104595400 [Nelumbo nucifera]|uniref:Uncharacterized protein LOC104595400 n=1 Tax=Nelumbo nucifera TaxID=4432 RepID=A0A1U7ZME8_NELNU|nr:PREDICTED: uncharacterized protein LOC104595400 [Nelumbo nucifera]
MACLPRMSIPSQALPFAKGPTSFLLSPFPRPRLHFSRFSFTSSGFSSPFHLHHSFRGFPSQSCPMSYRRHATNPGSSSPETDPPFEDDPIPATGLQVTLSRFQDQVQIFFAVLFWMSLFFWASTWEGRNSGRPGRGSRFRR